MRARAFLWVTVLSVVYVMAPVRRFYVIGVVKGINQFFRCLITIFSSIFYLFIHLSKYIV